jgi:CLIP-associating protein 1/2
LTDLPLSNLTLAKFKPQSKNLDEARPNYVPNFQRPLLRRQMTNWFFAKDKKENSANTSTQFKLGEMPGYADVPSSLTEALTEGLNPKSDWIMRVFVFNFLKSLLNHGPKGLQEVLQNFDKVMKLLLLHLDDPHYKVAHASLTTLEEIIPKCKKQTEHYLDRILPQVFSRFNDPKESIRKNASEILQIISENYGIDSILPGLLRCLDEQKAPRAKFAIIEYAEGNFEKCTVNTENYLGAINNFIKLWLGKLLILFKDKNTRLKEAAIVGILTIYTNYNPGSVLGFLTSLSVEEQKPLRLALKQRDPRIDVDLVNFMQAKKQRPRHAPSLDRYGVIEPAFNLHPKFKFRSVDFGSKTSSHLLENDDGPKGKFQKFSRVPSTIHEKSGVAVSSYQPDDKSRTSQIRNQVCSAYSLVYPSNPIRQNTDYWVNGQGKLQVLLECCINISRHFTKKPMLKTLCDLSCR